MPYICFWITHIHTYTHINTHKAAQEFLEQPKTKILKNIFRFIKKGTKFFSYPKKSVLWGPKKYHNLAKMFYHIRLKCPQILCLLLLCTPIWLMLFLKSKRTSKLKMTSETKKASNICLISMTSNIEMN